jgi:hypothetical protein
MHSKERVEVNLLETMKFSQISSNVDQSKRMDNDGNIIAHRFHCKINHPEAIKEFKKSAEWDVQEAYVIMTKLSTQM